MLYGNCDAAAAAAAACNKAACIALALEADCIAAFWLNEIEGGNDDEDDEDDDDVVDKDGDEVIRDGELYKDDDVEELLLFWCSLYLEVELLSW